LEKYQQYDAATQAASFRQKVISRGNRNSHQPTFTVGGVSNSGFKIFIGRMKDRLSAWFHPTRSLTIKHFE